MVVRKPIDIIAGELWDHDDPNEAAEDVIEALEENGWRFVFVPDVIAPIETLNASNR